MIFPFITTYWGSFFSNSKVLGSIVLSMSALDMFISQNKWWDSFDM